MNIPLPPQVIALLPLALDLIERGLDRWGLLGFPYVTKRLAGDNRAHFRDTVLDAGAPTGTLRAIAAYFEFEDRASDVLKSHIALLVSLIFAQIAKSRVLLQLEGWPVAALVVVTASLIWFLVSLVRQHADPANPHALKGWSRWVWAMFLVILVAEGGELVMR